MELIKISELLENLDEKLSELFLEYMQESEYYIFIDKTTDIRNVEYCIVVDNTIGVESSKVLNINEVFDIVIEYYNSLFEDVKEENRINYIKSITNAFYILKFKKMLFFFLGKGGVNMNIKICDLMELFTDTDEQELSIWDLETAKTLYEGKYVDIFPGYMYWNVCSIDKLEDNNGSNILAINVSSVDEE